MRYGAIRWTCSRRPLARLDGDQESATWLAGRDPLPVVAALTWLGERVYYLAATRTPPFDTEQAVIDVLTDAWTLALYGRRPEQIAPARPT
jgi:TetR/AcrR family transcriptional regulator, ethionamide resistance regulator